MNFQGTSTFKSLTVLSTIQNLTQKFMPPNINKINRFYELFKLVYILILENKAKCKQINMAYSSRNINCRINKKLCTIKITPPEYAWLF